jgi:hypothetical protein
MGLAPALGDQRTYGQPKREASESGTAAVNGRTAEASLALEKVCTDAVILVSLPPSPWRLVGLRTLLTNELALQVHPLIFDRIGWSHLGATVKIFGVFSEGAQQQALVLAPSRLQVGRADANPAEGGQRSFFLDTAKDQIADHVTEALVRGDSFSLTTADHLVLCDLAYR